MTSFEQWKAIRAAMGLSNNKPHLYEQYQEEQEAARKYAEAHAWEKNWLHKEEESKL